MCIPLTPAQIAELQKEKDNAQASIDKYIEVGPKRAQKVAEQTLVDEGFKAAFDFYDVTFLIIRNMDVESRQLKKSSESKMYIYMD